VQVVINKGDYDQLDNILKTMLGIEVVVSPRRATAKFMQRSLSTEPFSVLAELPNGGGRILELRINHSSPCVGKTVKDIQLPIGSLFVAIQHKFKARVPAADDTILAGDRVLVLVNKEQEKDLINRLL
jgi:trk system potassium uptake protein TrkA